MAKRRKRRAPARSAKGRFLKKSASAPKRRRKRRAATGKRRPAMGYVVGSKKIRRRKLNPRARRRRYRRNPIGLPSMSGIVGQLTTAALGAAGGMALNIALSFLPLPDVLKTGYMRHATRIAGAIGLGVIARKFLGAKGNAVAAGALTIAMYDLGKQVLQTVTPELGSRLGDFEDVTVSDDSGFYDPASVVSGMDAYLEGPLDGVGGIDDYGNADDIGGMSAYMEGELDGLQV